MVTKWRKFTSRTLVKAVCFLLIIVLCFLMLSRAYDCIQRMNTERVSPEIVFAGSVDYGIVYQYHIANAYYYAALLAKYKSESSILGGEYVKWTMKAQEIWDNDDVTYRHMLTDSAESVQYNFLSDADYQNPELRSNAEQAAIRNQLSEFRKAREVLEGKYGDTYGTEGISYYIESDGIIFSNTAVGNQNKAYFKKQPVYIIRDELGITETSQNMPMTDYAAPGLYSGTVPQNETIICAAFDYTVANSRVAEYINIKNQYELDFIIIGVSALSILALFIVLLSGAGRRQFDNGAGIHLTFLDKPYLDLSLTVTVCWVTFIILAGISLIFYNNISLNAAKLILAAGSLIAVTPALMWILSFAKRVKTGRFWRHTLIFAVLNGLRRLIISLWAGFPLTAKVALISLISFVFLIITGLTGEATYHSGSFFMVILALFLTAVVTFFLLRYAQRIYKLKLGAIEAAGGGYDCEINVGKGELGSIADSINNISAGINRAVEQRMKSERLKTELITNVSHDIRTPLTSIITYTDLLKREGLSHTNAPEYLDIIIQKSERLKILTDELFEAAKAATGNIDVNITELDLTSLINQVLGELDGAIIASKLDLRVKLPERMPVMADGKLMWRVMENLMSNVFKYALPDSRVYLDAEREQGFFRIDLKNISADELNVEPSELIERFKRGDASRTDGGSGLGLSIVQSFISAQHGKLALSIDGDLFKASVYLPVSSGNR